MTEKPKQRSRRPRTQADRRATARLLSSLLLTPDDDLERFRDLRLGGIHKPTPARLRQVRQILEALGDVLQGDGDSGWLAVEAAWEQLQPGAMSPPVGAPGTGEPKTAGRIAQQRPASLAARGTPPAEGQKPRLADPAPPPPDLPPSRWHQATPPPSLDRLTPAAPPVADPPTPGGATPVSPAGRPPTPTPAAAPHLPPLAPPPMQGADEMGTLLDTGVPIGPVLPFGPAAAQSPVAQSPTSAPDLEEDGETLVWTDPAGDTPADSPGTGGPAETDAVDETLLGVEMSPEPVLPFVPPTGEDEQAE